MYQRRIFSLLESHLAQPQITVITGMRRVGKSTAIRYLLEKTSHNNKLYLDLERVEIRFLFQKRAYSDIKLELEAQGLDLSKPAVLALDEIQLAPEMPSVLKWLHDTSPGLKILVTGSSSYYLRNLFSESLAGRKHVFEMFPLDFGEFLLFKDADQQILERFAFQNTVTSIYLKYKSLYEEYLQYGGFPEVVLTPDPEFKRRTLQDVLNSYINIDIRLFTDLEAGDTLFKLIKMLAAHSGSLLDTQNLSSAIGVDRRRLNNYIELLEKTYFIHTISPYTKNTESEIRSRKKVYLADTGLLQQLAQVSSGQVFENAIFLQLAKRNEQVQYYRRKTGQEIDFILDEKIAVEVKETPTEADRKSLFSRAQQISITEQYLIGRNIPGNQWTDFVWAGQVV